MNPIASKKEARLESKKRKLVALASITKLNKTEMSDEANCSATESNSESANTDEEPNTKKIKLQTEENAASVLSDEDYLDLKRKLNHKRRELKNVPKQRLKLFGENASLAIPSSIRTPIFLTDVQHLIMYALFGSSSPCIPTRWCHLEKVNKLSHTVVLMIDGLSLYDFSSHESKFAAIADIFEHKLEVVVPQSEGAVNDEMMMAPLANIRQADLISEYGSLEAAIESIKNPVLMVNSIFPVSDNETDSDVIIPPEETIPRTQLLLSALQMVEEGYPLPLRGELANRYKNFVMTKDKYKAVSGKSPMFGVDCEMCRTSAGVNELTRISIINEQEESIYETLVCPQNKIVDYLTQFSGITPQMMKNVTKTLKEVQDDVRRILPADAILVGQSLQSDLMAMRMMHPYVIDTSIIFNISGDRRRKSKLQTLAHEFLGEKIQKNPLGHDSIEDCSASLKLTKLKLEKGIEFGDTILITRRRVTEKNASLDEKDPQQSKAKSSSTNKMDRNTAVITSNESDSEAYEKIIKEKLTTTRDDRKIAVFKTTSNKNAIKQTCEVALNNALTFTHFNVAEKSLNDDKIDKTIHKMNQWIEDVWKSIALNSLCVILLTGRKSTTNSSSGVVMLQVKR